MSSKKIDFLLPAEVAAGATSGILLGDFNNWDSDNGVALNGQRKGNCPAIGAIRQVNQARLIGRKTQSRGRKTANRRVAKQPRRELVFENNRNTTGLRHATF